MRAFSFDKEPAFKSMEATSIWGSLISAGASLVGGAMGAKGAKNAAATAAAGNQDALQAEREAYLNARGALQPYVNRGNKAQGYLDALLYGHGSYADAPLYAPAAAESFDAVLKEQNPGAWATWQGWEQKLKPSSYTKGHRAVYGDFEGFLKATDPGAIQRAQESLNASAAPGASGAGSTITRDDAYANLQQTLPWQFNEQDYTKRDALNEEDYAKLNALNEEDYLKAQGFTNDEIAAWVANAQAEQDKSIDALFNRGGLTGQVGATRRGVAQVGEEFARDRAQYEAGRRRADYDPYAQRRVGNYDQFSKRRASNYDTYAGGRLSAYGGYLDQLGRDSDRGYQAGTGIASAGQTYANNASELLGAGARAQAQAGYDAASAWGAGIKGATGYLNEAWKDYGQTQGSTKVKTPNFSWGGVKNYNVSDLYS